MQSDDFVMWFEVRVVVFVCCHCMQTVGGFSTLLIVDACISPMSTRTAIISNSSADNNLMNPSSVSDYTFLSPRQIVFGWGRRAEIGQLTQSLGRRAFLVTGSRTLEQSGRISEMAEDLKDAGIDVVSLASISHEPEVADVDSATAQIRQHEIRQGDFVIAIGGGSAIDLAKAVAAMATNSQSPTVQDYLEGVGKGLTISEPPLPLIAVPTTAGTGTEATKNAVISSYDPAFKKSLRSNLMMASLVLVDPELGVTAPQTVTAHTGMDAITQLIESYISNRAKPIAQALCLHGLELAIPALPAAYDDGQCRWARESMSHAALLSGMALANSGLGMAHGVAAALGVHARVPHGLACAVMLPVAMRVNRPARSRELARLARIFTPNCPADESAAADHAVDFIDTLCRKVDIPRKLSDIGVTARQLPSIVSSSRGNSMNGNPVELSDDQLGAILEEMR